MTTKDTKSTTEEKEDDKRPIRPQIDTKRTIKRHKTTTDKIKIKHLCGRFVTMKKAAGCSLFQSP